MTTGRARPGTVTPTTSPTAATSDPNPTESVSGTRSPIRPPIHEQPDPTSIAPPSTTPSSASDAPRSWKSGAA